MTKIITNLLTKLRENNIKLVLKDGRLEVKSYSKKIAPELIREIKSNKSELITYLGAQSAAKEMKISLAVSSESYPLSPSQKRLWVINQYEETSNLYNIYDSISFDFEINSVHVEKAVTKVIERHEILRTVFKENKDKEVHQWILPTEDLDFQIGNLDFSKETDPELTLTDYIEKDASKSFDFVNGPLLRMSLIKMAKDRYILYYCIHHIIFDGWSSKILINDVLHYYNLSQGNTNKTLPDLEIQYKDFSVWQMDQLTSDIFKNHQKYWKEKLSGEIALIDLPSDKKRPNLVSYNGYKKSLLLSKEASKEFKNFCSLQEASLFIGVVSVLNILLHKYTAQTDITIGTSAADRSRAELEKQIGFYVNTMALRNEVIPSESFSAFLKRTNASILNDFSHQEYPFDKVIEDLKLKRNPSRNSLLDVFVTFANNEREQQYNPRDIDFLIKDLGETKAKYDLDIGVSIPGEYLRLDIIYNQDIYDAQLIEEFMNHFHDLIKVLLKKPNECIEKISFLSDLEQQQQLVDFNPDIEEIITQQTIVDLFAQQAMQTPEVIAVEFGKKKISYKELNKTSTAFALFLKDEHQITKGDIVGIYLDHNEWTLIAILGILKAGGVFAPIQPNLPDERKTFMVQDTNMKLMVTDTTYMFELDFYNGNMTAIDVEFEFSDDIDISLTTQSTINDLAYIIYTSGSTGKPKGVQIAHGSLTNYLLWAKDAYLSEKLHNFNFGLFTPLSFDLTITSLFLPIISGGTLTVFDNHKDLGEILQKYLSSEIACIKLTPAHIHLLNGLDIKPTDVKTQMAIVGGDALQDSHVKTLQKLNPTIKIYNEYGPTEATVGCVVQEIQSASQITIGKPIGNTHVYILNNELQLNPLGVAGEIYIAGKCLSLGYLNREELTTERFIPNPFRKGELMYKSGDLGKWKNDGEIVYLGRKDDQVKIRGYRIELGEIEQVLLAQKEIEATVVVANKVHENDELVAYIVTKETIDQAAIKATLLKKLPEYMVPNLYIQIDEIPLSTNGKVDKKKLPMLTELLEEEFIVATSEEEKVLVSVLQEVLKQETIGIKGNFYNMGGDSIKSILVVSKLKQLGYTLKVDDILKYPIVENLAKHLKENTHVVDQKEVSGDVILTPIQHHFFESAKIKNVHHYNQSVILKSKERIELKSLEKSIEALVKHHDALRMTYTQRSGQWKQYNRGASQKHYTVQEYDLRETENPLKEIEIIGTELQTSFDIETSPLVRVVCFKLKDSDRIGFVIHHLVIDGISWRVLLDDFGTLYTQVLNGEKIELPLKTDSFQQWAISLEKYAKSSDSLWERKYWESIQEQQIIPIPKIAVITEETEVKTNEIQFAINQETTNLLQTKFHNVYRTNNNDVLLASLGLAIQETFGLDSCVLEMDGHGREEIIEGVDISRTVGWFTSIYPFVLNVAGNYSNIEKLIKIKDDLRKLPNKGMGYGILKHLNQDFKGNLEPSITFNFLGDFGEDVGGATETVRFEYSSENLGRNIALENEDSSTLDISGMIVEGKLHMNIRYPLEIYDTEAIHELRDNYNKYLVSLINEVSKETETYKTPSDFTFKGLSIEEFNEIQGQSLIEDVYKLSPLQQGIYYHWLADKDAVTYFEQMSYRLKIENLNVAAIQKVYDKILEKYAVLRTSFQNDYAGVPLQIVHVEGIRRFSFEKLPENLDAIKIKTYVEKRAFESRSVGFNLEEASQISLQIIQTQKDEYEFIWNHHHILMDGWCMSILINDFYKMYEEVQHGQEIDTTLLHKYSNYIKWLDKLNIDKSLGYWKEYLKDYNTTSKIPFKREKSATSNNEHLHHRFIVEGEMFSKVKELCRKNNITQNTFIQAVWGYLLGTYNTTNDVVFGAVVSGRPGELTGVQDMVGLFINTIPVRISFEESITIPEFLATHNANTISSNKHHYNSLSDVQSMSKLGMNLMDHIMVFENYYVQESNEVEQAEITDDQPTQSRFEMQSSNVFEQNNYDFHIVVGPSDTSLSIEFRYDKDMFDATDIENCGKHFFNTIKAFCNPENEQIKDLTYLSDQEKHFLLEKYNTTSTDLPKNKNCVQLFEEIVEANEDNIGLVYNKTQLSYSEINERANSIADYLLREKNAMLGDNIAIELGSRIDISISALLGVLKTGGTYTLVDNTLPKERIDYVIKDAKCICYLQTEELLQILASKAYSTENPNVQYEASNVAYIIYTSGTTGLPKGVQVRHNSIINYASWFKTTHNITSNDTTILTSSIAFDLIYTSFYGGLLSGSKIHIVNELTIKDPMAMSKYIAENNISFLKITPTYLNFLLSNTQEDSILNSKSLRLILTGGEHQNINDVQKIVTETDIQLVNHYGPTETTIGVCTYEINKSNLSEYISTPVIGYPITNTSIIILNDALELQPTGIVGNVYIGGIGLSNGYINNEELTAEKFIKHPFDENQLLYNTGDLGKRLSNGTIALLGRKDDQKKINGYRVELGEIETQLKTKQNITDAVAIIREYGNLKEIVAYFISDTTFNASEIRSYLSQKIPSYMIPSHYIQLDALPRTANGKVDKKALANINTAVSAGSEYIAPNNTKEKVLARVWENVLNHSKIGVKDNFFTLGGNSLKSVMVISKLKKEGYTLSISDLLKTPTIESLAKLLLKKEVIQTMKSTTQKEWNFGDTIQISPNQKRFFKSKYSSVFLHCTTHNYQEDTFDEKFRHFLSLFPMLCMQYAKVDGRIIQKYIPASRIIIETIIKNGGNIKDDEWLHQYNTKPFDVLQEALVKVLIVPQYKAEKTIIGMVIHHSLLDAYSSNIIQKALKDYFDTGSIQKSYNLSYFNFIKWQENYLQSSEALEQKLYWRNLLKDNTDNYVTHDVTEKISSFISYNVVIEGEELQLLEEMSNVLNVPVSGILLGYYQKLLGQIEVDGKNIVGVMVSGREEQIENIDMQSLIGVIDNLLPIPVMIDDNMSNKEYLKKCYSKYLEARVNQRIPYETIREDFKKEFKKDIDRLLAGRFNYQIDKSSNYIYDIEKPMTRKIEGHWLKGIHLTAFMHSNTLEIQLMCSEDIYNEHTEILASLSKKNLIISDEMEVS
ncbi:amino acid adenylation domain-containing protein [Kordia sp.]|uniref:amino acid adenylation domain-containing protein n=1 Tax=Kordia sp. TaxID=1965332 RepID=UPI003B5CA6CB